MTSFFGTAVGLVLKREQDPARNVASALAVAGLPSAVVGRGNASVSEPRCVRERETDFELLVGQNFWRLESLVKQVGEFTSSGRVETVPCGEELPRVFPGAVFNIFLRIGGRLAAQLIVTAVLWFFNGCSRRARANGVVVEDRPRSRRRRWRSSVT